MEEFTIMKKNDVKVVAKQLLMQFQLFLGNNLVNRKSNRGLVCYGTSPGHQTSGTGIKNGVSTCLRENVLR